MADNQILTQRQNLISRLSRGTTRPTGFYKSILLDLLAVVFAFGFGYVYKLYLAKSVSLLPLAFALTAFLALTALELYLTRSFGRRMLVIILEAIFLVLPFYGEPLKTISVAAALFILFATWAEINGRREMTNTLEVRFFKTSKPVFNKTITAIAIMMVLFYLPHLNVRDVFLSESAFQTFYDWASGIVGNFYPEINFGGTFFSVASGIARQKLEATPAFKDYPKTDQDNLIKDTANNFAADIRKQFKIDIDPEKPASQVFYNAILSTIEQWKQKFGDSFSGTWAVILFLTIWSAGALFGWVAAAIAFLVYQLLISFGVIHITGESRTKETVEF